MLQSTRANKNCLGLDRVQDIDHLSPDPGLAIFFLFSWRFFGMEEDLSPMMHDLAQNHFPVHHGYYQTTVFGIGGFVHHKDISGVYDSTKGSLFLGPQKECRGRVGLQQGVQTKALPTEISTGSGKSCGTVRGHIGVDTIHRAVHSCSRLF